MTLYFLNHPGSELFSGYGITADGHNRAHLYGIIMVDRLILSRRSGFRKYMTPLASFPST